MRIDFFADVFMLIRVDFSPIAAAGLKEPATTIKGGLFLNLKPTHP
jgi:hypothetical protein